MAPFSPIRSRHPIRVVLSATAFLPFMSVRKAAALAIAQFGIAAFFIPGLARVAVGDSAGWFVLAAAVLAAFARSIDIESWSLLIPGGFVGSVTRAFGPRAAGVAKAAALVERFLLGALACVLVGHYAASVSASAIAGRSFTGYLRAEDLATLIAIGALGVLWLQTRLGREIGARRAGASELDWNWHRPGHDRLGAGHAGAPRRRFIVAGLAGAVARTGWVPADAALAWLLGFALTLPVVGGGEALAHAAPELPPPRVQALRRTGLAAVLFTVVAIGRGNVPLRLARPGQ